MTANPEAVERVNYRDMLSRFRNDGSYENTLLTLLEKSEQAVAVRDQFVAQAEDRCAKAREGALFAQGRWFEWMNRAESAEAYNASLIGRQAELERERDIALMLHRDALRLAGVDVTEAYEIGRGLRPSPFESGWLIEKWDSRRNEFRAEWWSLNLPGDEDGQGWTKDSLLALRFARERDAQDYINEIGWTEAKPTEHGWARQALADLPLSPVATTAGVALRTAREATDSILGATSARLSPVESGLPAADNNREGVEQ